MQMTMIPRRNSLRTKPAVMDADFVLLLIVQMLTLALLAMEDEAFAALSLSLLVAEPMK